MSGYWSRAHNRRISRQRFLRGTGVLVTGAGAAAVVGCGGDDDDEGSGVAGSPTAASTAPDGEISEITPGGKLVRAHPYPEGALSLDPHTQESDGSQQSIRVIYSNLLKYQEEEPGQRVMVGELAESWERPDELTVVFKLRPGVKFQNLPPVNGREMTAEDVVYSFERMKTDDPRYVMRSTFAMLEKIEAIDANTVRMTTPFPYAPLLHNIAFPWASIVAREVVEKGDIENSPVGTGPFILVQYARGSTILYRKNPDYFKSGRPYLDEYETPIMPDVSARIAAFRAGQTGVEAIPAPQVDAIKASNPDATVQQTVNVNGGVIRFNSSQPPFNDERVRQAIAYATNVQEYIDAVGQGAGVRTGPMPVAIRNWALDESEFHEFDLTKAKQLMAAAGFEDGFEVHSSATVPYGSVDLTEITAAQLKKIGIDVKIDVLDNAAWIEKSYRASDFAFSTYVDYAYSDPDRGLRDHYHSKGSNNNNNWSDPQLDTLLDKQREIFEEDARREVVLDIQRTLIEKAPRVWLYATAGYLAVQPWLKNYKFVAVEASNNFQFYDELWIKRG